MRLKGSSTAATLPMIISAVLAALLSACGGGGDAEGTMAPSASATPQVDALAVDGAPTMTAEKRKLRFSLTDLGSIGAIDINNHGSILYTRGSNIFIHRHGIERSVPTGCMQTASALSDSGIVAGTGASRPVIYARSTCVDLGTLGGTRGVAVDVNRSGQVAGTSAVTGDTTSHAFLYEDGAMRDLGTLRGGYSAAAAINERGMVAGTSDGTAFLYRHRRMVDLGSLSTGGLSGPKGATAKALNNAGEVVGSSWLPCASDPICPLPIEHAFIFTGGVMKDIDTLNSFSSVGNSINNHGVVVGFATPTDDFSTFAGFLYRDGRMERLTDLLDKSAAGVWIVKSAESINDDNEILATAVQSSAPTTAHAVLLRPSGGR